MATRRESVVLSLQDDLSAGMLKAAAATTLLEKSLDDLDGTTVGVQRSTEKGSKSFKEYSLATAIAEEKAARLRKTLKEQARAAIDAEEGISGVEKEIGNLGRSSDRADRSINQLTGRLAVMARVGASVGPGLIPFGAVGIAGVAGLASQLGFATTGALSLIVAFQGVGDALDAVNKAALEPTADNLAAAEQAMAQIGPQARAFVTEFQRIRPVLADMRDSAAAGWFPGLTEALGSLEDAAPRIESLLFAISEAGGNAVADGAASLAGPRWAEFLAFVEAEAPDAITALSRTVGSLSHGLAELWMAFDPLNDDVRDWLVGAAADFDSWAQGLDQTEGFREFIAYVRENGPKVAEASAAIGDAILEIVEAAAPLGGPVLEALTAIANAIALIADSPLGTPIMTAVTAMSALTLATNVATAALGRFKVAQAAVGMGGGKSGAGAAAIGGPATVAGLAAFMNTSSAIGDYQADDPDTLVEKWKSASDSIRKIMNPGQSWGEGIGEKLFGGILPDETKTALPLLNQMADRARGLPAAFDPATKAVEENAAAVKELGQAYTDLNSVLSKQGAWDAYQASIDNMTASIAANGKTLDANTEAGRANRESLNNIAESAIRYSESLEGAEKTRFLNRAVGDFKAAAEAAGGLDKRAREVLQGLRDLAKQSVTPNINLTGAESAREAIARVKAEMAGIKDKTVRLTYYVNQVNAASKRRAENAQGIYASGGFTGEGGKHEPAGVVHRGEVVLPQEVVSRDASHLRSRYGYLPGMADLPGYANGGRVRGRTDYFGSDGNVILPGGLSAPLALFAQGLKGLERSLDRTEKALDENTKSRDAVTEKMTSLAGNVTGKFTGSIFGATDSWSSGGSLQDGINALMGQNATGQNLSRDIAALEALGLDGAALDALLSEADPATIASIAASATAAQVAEYERQYAMRADIAAQVGAAAGTAAYGASLAPLEAQVAQTNAELAQIKAAIKSADNNNTGGQKQQSKSQKRGAGNASRDRKRGSRP